MKVYAVYVKSCTGCPILGPAGAYCRGDIENLGPIELHDHIKNNTIHPDCPLPDARVDLIKLQEKVEGKKLRIRSEGDNEGHSKKDYSK